MAKDFAKDFYRSRAWKSCREAYAASVGGVCERCLQKGIVTAGEIVHHKIHVTPETINDPSVLLSWDNLELVCRSCHAELHGAQKRFSVEPDGKVISH